MKSEAGVTHHPINRDLHEIQSSRSDFAYVLAPYPEAAVFCKTSLPPYCCDTFKKLFEAFSYALELKVQTPFFYMRIKMSKVLSSLYYD